MLVLVGLLKQSSKELLFFVFQKFLLLCGSARPIPQRIAGCFELKLESTQIQMEARNYFLVHGAVATTRIITDVHNCLTYDSLQVRFCEPPDVRIPPPRQRDQFRDDSRVEIF